MVLDAAAAGTPVESRRFSTIATRASWLSLMINTQNEEGPQ
jgi:hypothetical protein